MERRLIPRIECVNFFTMDANKEPGAAPQKKILIVEDDARLATLIVELLENEGYHVSQELRGDTAVSRILDEHPDLVLLDINLPGKNGFTVCREVRSQYQGMIMMLTARGDEVDEVVGLDIGADDYMAKPLAPQRLLARIRMLFRRNISPQNPTSVQTGPLKILPERREVLLDGQPIDMSSAEFDLLWLLARHIGEVVDRDQIFKDLRGHQYDGADRSIDLRISRLRRHLGDDPTRPRFIKTVHGEGYLLVNEQ